MVRKLEGTAGIGSPVRRPVAQASVVPFRRDADGLRICLITSRKKQRWIFPKSTVLPPLDGIDAATNAAAIEAGVYGSVDGESVGTYKHLKAGKLHVVTVYAFEAERSEDSWCESDLRQRRWVSVEEARVLIVKDELSYMLQRVLERIAP